MIIKQSFLDSYSDKSSWYYQCYLDIRQKLEVPSEFPCVFSQNAFRRKLIQFCFVESVNNEHMIELADDLRSYIEDANQWDGKVNSAKPLIVSFSTNCAKFDTLEEYHNFGWDVLQKLHLLDNVPWPNNVVRNPNSPFWSMCFNGVQIFVNMSCPAHKIRKSRNLGQNFIMVINPRERFDIVAGDNEMGRKTRKTIRNRIKKYDGCKHSNQLGSYQAGEIEWWQYGIIEENIERKDECPFKFSEINTPIFDQ